MSATAAAPSLAASLAEALARLGRAAHGDGFAEGLNPAQWAALRYFERANRFSATVTAFARYQGTTQGTASQTVKALVAKGLLERRPHARDRRSRRLAPTGAGRETLASDPLHAVEAAADAIGEREQRRLLGGLEALLGSLAARRGDARFGVCRDCRHLGPCRRGGEGHECALLGEPLDRAEADCLCVNFEPRKARPSAGAPAT